MDEGNDEKKEELKPQVSHEVKVESSVVPPVISDPDVTVLHHDSNSVKGNSQKKEEYESLDPVDSRHLDSVYEYTSKIRQFIGLEDPDEVKTNSVSSHESEVVRDKPGDPCNPSVENLNVADPDEDKPNSVSFPENGIVSDKPDDIGNPDLLKKDINTINPNYYNQDQNYSNLTTENKGVPTTDNPLDADNNSGVDEPVISLGENNKELPLSVGDETEKTLISEDNYEKGQCSDNEPKKSVEKEDNVKNEPQKSLLISKEAEPIKTDDYGNNETTTIDVQDEREKQKCLSNGTNDKDLTDIVNVSPSVVKAENNSPESNRDTDLKKDSSMPTYKSEDKMETPLVESEENEACSSSMDLNSPEVILKDEECSSRNGENTLNPDKNILTPKNQELLTVNVDENEKQKMLDEPNTFNNEDNQNISSIEDDNVIEDNVINNSPSELYAISEEPHSNVTPDEIKQTPHFEDIRRLSVEIVNKVLDTAGTQLRDILNEKRKSSADANNLMERSSDLGKAYLSNEEPVKASNSESVHDSHDEDRNNLTMSEGTSSQLSEQPEVKQKLNNEIQLKEILAKTYDFNDFQKKIEVEMNKFDPEYDVLDPDIVCGIGCFKPRWIQPWATSRVYLILYSVIGILSGSYFSYLVGAMSTLEKRFAFKSKTSGYVMMLDEITPLLLGIFIGYFGGKSHRPRMVGFGMLLSAICCFISALPYFIYGPATHLSLGYSTIDNTKKLELCNLETREGYCDDEDRLPTLTPVLLLMLGSFLKGFGNLAYYAVGLAYMDDNAKKKNTPMYFAIAFSLRLLGPMVGFLMSSFFLKYYENPFVDPGFGTTDPRWIGCWWLGFLVQGVLLLIFTIPITLFPRRLPGTVDYTKSEEDEHLATSFVGLYEALKRLAKNPVYCLLVLNVIMGVYGSFGHYINLPRYMENQFRLSASTSNLISAPPSLGAVMISMTVGGYLIWKFKPGVKFLAAALCASELLQLAAYFILMIPRCEGVEMNNYGFNNDGLILQNECNSNCNCTTSAFSPVCGPDGATMFFSPCHAGCSEKVNGSYWNCSCVFDSSGQQRDYVTNGFCVTEDCWPSILAYTLTMPVVQLIVNLVKVGHTMIFLRSIKPEDKSVALGTFETLVCLFGFIPYPIVYGALVDSACLIWEKSCGETGNCWYYDVPKLNYILHGASALFSTFDALTLLGIFFLGSRVHDLYKEDYKTQDNTIAEKTESESQEERKDSHSITKLYRNLDL